MDTWGDLVGVATGKVFVEGDLDAQYLGLSVNSTDPGDSSPFWHTHSKIEEIYLFIDGAGQMALDEDLVEVGPGTIVRVGPRVWRALRCDPTSISPLRWLCLRGGGEDLTSIGNDADIDSDRSWPWD